MADEREDKAEAGAIGSFVEKLRGSGEAAFEELTGQLMENPLFLSALKKSLDAKTRIDRGVSGAMDLLNLPSKNDVEKLLEEIEGLRSRLVKQQRALDRLVEEVRGIRGVLDAKGKP